MPTFGPVYPTTVVNDTSYGSIAWNSPGNSAGVADGVYSSHTVNYTAASNLLKATGFNLSSLPSGVIITGFRVEWRVYASDSSAFSADRVLLGLGSAIGTTNRASTNPANFPGSVTWMAWGDETSDLFGLNTTRDALVSNGLCLAVADLHVNTGFVDTVWSDALRVYIGYNYALPYQAILLT
jgi:hypothetical protein